jgi:hypothetical protein
LYESFAGLKKKAGEVWDEFKPKILKAWDESIAPKIKSFWSDDLVPFLKIIAPKIGGAILDAFKWAWDFLSPFIKETAPKVGSAILDALKWAWDELGKQLGTGGQVGVGLAAAFSLGLGSTMVDMAGKAGKAFMVPLLSSKSGIMALATAAAAKLGWETAKKLISSGGTKGALALARSTTDEQLGQAYSSMVMGGKSEWFDESLELFERGKKEEEETWVPNKKIINELDKAIARFLVVKNQAKYGGVIDTSDYIDKSVQVEDPAMAEFISLYGESYWNDKSYGTDNVSENVAINNAQGIANTNIGKVSPTSKVSTDTNAIMSDVDKKLKQVQNKKTGTVDAIKEEGMLTRQSLSDIYSELKSQSRLMGGGRGKGGRGADASVAPVGN